jgi:hypothetical protein
MTAEPRSPEPFQRTIKNFKEYVQYAGEAAAILEQQGNAKNAAFFHGMTCGAALTVSYLVDELGDLAEANRYWVFARDIQYRQIGNVGFIAPRR